MANISEELTRLAQLRDQGVLTNEEFDAQKAAVLRGDTPANAAPPVGAEKRQGVLKGCGIAVVAIIALLFIAGLFGSGGNKTPVDPPKGGSEATTADSGGGVTMEQYNRLKNGMSYQAAIAILGQPGEEMSRNEMAGTETVMYQWSGTSLGGNMNAMFQNNKLVQKAQFGLQ